MISPFMKWDHSEDFFYMNYATKAMKSEDIYTINISDPDYEFVTDHLIDGESIDPEFQLQ
jgi:hypothetical protein